MTHLKYYALKRVLDSLINQETIDLVEATNIFQSLGYAFDLRKLIDGIVQVYPLDGQFYIIEFTRYNY